MNTIQRTRLSNAGRKMRDYGLKPLFFKCKTCNIESDTGHDFQREKVCRLCYNKSRLSYNQIHQHLRYKKKNETVIIRDL